MEGKDEEGNQNVVEQQNGRESEEGEEEKKDEMTENEKHIEKLKIETEKARAALRRYIKQESIDSDKQADEANESVQEMAESINIKVEVDAIVDVVSDTAVPKESETKDEVAIPLIYIEHSTTDVKIQNESLNSEQDNHPRGSSHTIIHEDHVNSLNELFAPAQNFQQYSPTLGNLNPQQLNQSLTEALSKQQRQAVTMTTASVSKCENSETNVLAMKLSSDQADTYNNQNIYPVKNPLAPKPSIDIKLFTAYDQNNEVKKSALTPKPSFELQRFDSFDQATLEKSFKMLSTEHFKSNDFNPRRQNIECVQCSDDERSISPENALAACHKTYPQEDRVITSTKSNISAISSLSKHNIFPLMQLAPPAASKAFENSLLFKELASKCSNAAATINSLQVRLPNNTLQQLNIPNKALIQDLVQFQNMDPKNLPPNVLNYLKPISFVTSDMKDMLSSTPTSVPTSSVTPENRMPDSKISPKSSNPLKPSLLEQRLLDKTVKSEMNVDSTNAKPYLLPNISAGIPPMRVNADSATGTDIEMTNSEITSSYDHVLEKSKSISSSLRINPPITTELLSPGSRTWVSEVKEAPINNSPSVSTFRIPAPSKTHAMNTIHAFSNMSVDHKKMLMKQQRGTQPIAIAPAPQPPVVQQVMRNDMEYPDTGINMFTGTNFSNPV